MRASLLGFLVVTAACGGPALPGASDAGGSSTDDTLGPDWFATEVVSVTYGDNAGFGQDRFPGVVLGPPVGGGMGRGGTDVVSLGNGGSITLRMGRDIEDGDGPDFIVFENPFLLSGQSQTWAEPGRVEVSLDGTSWTPFPCDESGWPFTGCAGVAPVLAPGRDGGISPVDPAVSGGDKFDLHDVGMARARYVRITDLDLQVFPAPTAGFDLDAVAVVRHAAP